jgi:hypothetical protein
MLSIEQLQSYDNWVGRSPQEIRGSVLHHKGWAKVFPRSRPFPLWASRVRNYFNETPTQLKLLRVGERSRAKSREKIDLGSLLKQGGLIAVFAFSGDVYKDEAGRFWFEMSTIGTPYHYKGRGASDATWYKTWEAFVSRQKSTPVFKLTSPDRTGGSLELCVHNWQHHGGKSEVGPEGKLVNIRTKVVINEIYKGSYNYSETGIVGLDEHEFRDVEPHREEYGFYVDPPPKMSARRFPRNDGKGRAIAESHRYYAKAGRLVKKPDPEPIAPTTRARGAPHKEQHAGTHVSSSGQVSHR